MQGLEQGTLRAAKDISNICQPPLEGGSIAEGWTEAPPSAEPSAADGVSNHSSICCYFHSRRLSFSTLSGTLLLGQIWGFSSPVMRGWERSCIQIKDHHVLGWSRKVSC